MRNDRHTKKMLGDNRGRVDYRSLIESTTTGPATMIRNETGSPFKWRSQEEPRPANENSSKGGDRELTLTCRNTFQTSWPSCIVRIILRGMEHQCPLCIKTGDPSHSASEEKKSVSIRVCLHHIHPTDFNLIASFVSPLLFHRGSPKRCTILRPRQLTSHRAQNQHFRLGPELPVPFLLHHAEPTIFQYDEETFVRCFTCLTKTAP